MNSSGEKLDSCAFLKDTFDIYQSSPFISNTNLALPEFADIIFFDNDSVIVSGLENIDCLIDDYRSYFFDGMIIN